MTVDRMDAVVELTGKYSQRVTEVTAHTPQEAIDDNGGMNSNNLANNNKAKQENVTSLHSKAAETSYH